MPMSVISWPQQGQPGGLAERVAAEVRALNGRYGVTQNQLASVLGITQPAVSKRLRGVTPFTLDEIDRLAEFFNVDPSELLGGTRVAPRPDGPDGGQRQGRRDRQNLPVNAVTLLAVAA